MSSCIRRSPLFYVGDKYKLISQIVPVLPKKIRTFYEPFVGGGTVFLNVNAESYNLNDNNADLILLHKFLLASSNNPEKFFNNTRNIIKEYNLSYSYEYDIIPSSLKLEFKKTYYAKFNKEGYYKLRDSLNRNGTRDPLKLYLLLIYGFNRMLRFNGKGEFNLPVGNVDFNMNVAKALASYFAYVKGRNITLNALDFREFFTKTKITKSDFVYADPPYIITSSEYNKNWTLTEERNLLEILDTLTEQGIRFALSNVIHYNGHKNKLLENWQRKYCVHEIQSNYISYNNNGKKSMREVLITNYEKTHASI